MLNTNEGGTHTAHTPLLGASLADMLKIASGETPKVAPRTEVADKLYSLRG